MELTHLARREGAYLSFLRRELSMSSSLVCRLKFQNAYFLNGLPVHTDARVRPGDRICVRLEEPEPDYPAEPGPLAILYEDEALLALDKEPGLMVHPSSCRNTGTLANRVIAYYGRTGQKSAFHPVSRLDRDTFGVVLLAKNAHVHALLCAAQRAGALRKVYLAAVFGCPPEAGGVIRAPIAREDPRRMLRCVRPDGARAVTEYRLVCRGREASLLLLRPVTGRTHQLRVHMAYLGCPVLGDPQYGPEEARAWAAARGLHTQQLCAAGLSLRHPLTGAPLALRSRQAVALPDEARENRVCSWTGLWE